MISRKEFLTNRDETGRLIVDMLDGTGQSYMVEFIEPRGHRTYWGDIDPATKKTTGTYGAKYTGGIKEEDSLLTPANGYHDAEIIPGASYMGSVIKKHEKWKLENGYG
jgi:hypothetical protein